MMTQESELFDRTADESLLGGGDLPVELMRPAELPESRLHARLVGLGVTMTAVTLIVGIVLLVAASAMLFVSPLLAIVGFASGGLLVGTHWGWVHVAEAGASAIDARRSRPVVARRQDWLLAIAPYPRYEVTTTVTEDGAIEIVRVCHRPVATREGRFGFESVVEHRERHEPDEPGATVAERAELLRRETARDTETARLRYERWREDRESDRLTDADTRERLAAQRAASEALSERINEKLRDPPL